PGSRNRFGVSASARVHSDIGCTHWCRGARSFDGLALLEFSLRRALQAEIGARAVGFFNKAMPLGAIRDARSCCDRDFADRHYDVSAGSHVPKRDVKIQHSVLSDAGM